MAVLHLSRDNGDTWQEITPPDLPEWTMISGIEPSPFDAGHRLRRRHPLQARRLPALSLRDPRLRRALDPDRQRHPASDDFTRVIRADPARQGLLYAGTETGVYVSFDDGANWQRFQLNLPVAPIHELLVKGSDLIAGTHGRSIWILDDLTPLRRSRGRRAVPDGEPYLFAPRDTIRVLPGIDWADDVAGSTNYLGMRPGGFIVETTPDGEAVRTYLDAGENPPARRDHHLPAGRRTRRSRSTLTFSDAERRGDSVLLQPQGR